MLLGPRRAAKARGRGRGRREPRRERKGPKVRGTPQKRWMLFDFRIRDKLRNSQGARCYRARIVKLFRPPLPPGRWEGSFRTSGNARLSSSRRRSRSRAIYDARNLVVISRLSLNERGIFRWEKTRGAAKGAFFRKRFASGLKMAPDSSDPFFTLSRWPRF